MYSILNVELLEAELVFDIATPNVEPLAPFVTDYVEYKRYETVSTETVNALEIRADYNKLYEIQSDIYSLLYMPNSIYVWVAPNNAMTYRSHKEFLI